MGSALLVEACGLALVIGGAAGVASVAGLVAGWRPKLGFLSMCAAGIACAAGMIVLCTPGKSAAVIEVPYASSGAKVASAPSFERAEWPRAEMPNMAAAWASAMSNGADAHRVPAFSTPPETSAPLARPAAGRVVQGDEGMPSSADDSESAYLATERSGSPVMAHTPGNTAARTTPASPGWVTEQVRAMQAVSGNSGVPTATAPTPSRPPAAPNSLAAPSPVYVPVPIGPTPGMSGPSRPRAMVITRGASPVVLVLE